MRPFGLRTVLWLALALAAAYGAWSFAPKYFAAEPDPRSRAFLSSVAAEINRSVPVMIDPETELLGAVGGEGMLTYRYRLIRYSTAQLNHERFREGAKQRVTQAACSAPETRDGFLKKGVTLQYAYFDRDKEPIAAIEVNPADCGF